ncbi:MAG: hypothetical protein NTY23_11070 [Chloroflexi bacterium]|nr:hypothetical protein [Chloroflexota bacterium]
MTVYSPEYVGSLERRIASLEAEVQQLRTASVQTNTSLEGLKSRLPTTSLGSPKFLSRAFTVWGHYFVAQVIIAVPIYCLIFLIGALASYGQY